MTIPRSQAASEPLAQTPRLIENARSVERLYRRQVFRRLLFIGFVAGLIILVRWLALPVARHIRSSYYLGMSGCAVDWQIGGDTWDTLGATRVGVRQGFWNERLSSDEILDSLEALIHLKGINLAECPAWTDDALRRLANFVHLEEVNLARLNQFRYPQWGHAQGRLGDSCLRTLAKLRKLETLDLAGNQITDKGMESIGTMTSLVDLRLDATEITDKGLDHLLRLPRLRSVSIGATRVSEKAMIKLQSARPELEISTEIDSTVRRVVEDMRRTP